MSPKLSIAIPTYNRSQFLQGALDRLFASDAILDAQIEIVISDNASTDNTEDIIHSASEKYGKEIHYFRNEKNLGIDGNIHQVVNRSNGEYVWMLSDDDVIADNAIDYVLNKINQQNFCFHFLNAKPLNLEGKTSKVIDTDQDIITTDNNIFIEKIWVWATFISSFLFKREHWINIHNREDYIGTDIYLTYTLYALLANNPSEKKIIGSTPIILIRSQYTGSYRIFYAFGYQWFKLLTETAVQMGFDRSCLKRIARKSILRDLIFRVYSAKLNSTASLSIENIRNLTRYTYAIPIAWLTLYPILIFPISIIKFTKRIFGKIGIKPSSHFK
ncbi:glycosyltransferase family 2 protein [Aquitalea palustris]|uniref:Glycosyltransferase family 2 protein n=1 Tax=Aquitalea palustris TaxID=2480983 RepID=A0A454JJR8_9NEIS|nr:glycosyltransferase family 2 protein [Aquitalea palustris]RMC99280.1 glycosyltransferase family 2 protein [Aquitalea palustris]